MLSRVTYALTISLSVQFHVSLVNDVVFVCDSHNIITSSARLAGSTSRTITETVTIVQSHFFVFSFNCFHFQLDFSIANVWLAFMNRDFLAATCPWISNCSDMLHGTHVYIFLDISQCIVFDSGNGVCFSCVYSSSICFWCVKLQFKLWRFLWIYPYFLRITVSVGQHSSNIYIVECFHDIQVNLTLH